MPRLTLADKAAFAVLAAGLLALGGVLLAAGFVLLLALVAGGVLIGTAAVVRTRLLRTGLFGRPHPSLRQGEIPATAVVLPAQAQSAEPTPPVQPGPPGAAARGD